MRNSTERLKDKRIAFKKIRYGIDCVDVVAYDLKRVFGMTQAVQRLEAAVHLMQEYLYELNKINDEDERCAWQQTQEGSANVLRAALAGVELGQINAK